MKVSLSVEELNMIKEIAKQRYENNRKVNNYNIKMSKEVGILPYHADIVGLCGEWAVCKALNIDIDSITWVYDNKEFTKIKHDIFDVGSFEVRATEYKNGRLVIKASDIKHKGDVPFISCSVSLGGNRSNPSHASVSIRGWRTPNESKKIEWEETYYSTAYYVPNDELYNISELFEQETIKGVA